MFFPHLLCCRLLFSGMPMALAGGVRHHGWGIGRHSQGVFLSVVSRGRGKSFRKVRKSFWNGALSLNKSHLSKVPPDFLHPQPAREIEVLLYQLQESWEALNNPMNKEEAE